MTTQAPQLPETATQRRLTDLLAERDAVREENTRLRMAGERCLAALRANGAPNCEAAKEMIAALAKVAT